MKSMTGFGRFEGLAVGSRISVEIRTLNHRFLETTVKLPPRFSRLEGEITKLLTASLARGKVELWVRENGSADDPKVGWNGKLAEAYVRLLKREARRLRLKDDLALSDLIHLPELFNRPFVGASDEECTSLRRIVAKAVARCVAMRVREGGALKRDMAVRLRRIDAMIRKIDRQRGLFVQVQKGRLMKQAALLQESLPFDSQRLEDQVAVVAEKGDVTEEIARARSHLAQMKRLLVEKQPVGRRLDFLIQELQREINTIGSKGQSVVIAREVVEFKSELEKIREQVQNIE